MSCKRSFEYYREVNNRHELLLRNTQTIFKCQRCRQSTYCKLLFTNCESYRKLYSIRFFAVFIRKTYSGCIDWSM